MLHNALTLKPSELCTKALTEAEMNNFDGAKKALIQLIGMGDYSFISEVDRERLIRLMMDQKMFSNDKTAIQSIKVIDHDFKIKFMLFISSILEFRFCALLQALCHRTFIGSIFYTKRGIDPCSLESGALAVVVLNLETFLKPFEKHPSKLLKIDNATYYALNQHREMRKALQNLNSKLFFVIEGFFVDISYSINGGFGNLSQGNRFITNEILNGQLPNEFESLKMGK